MGDQFEQEEPHTRIHALVKGQVQGVGYRAFTQHQGRQRHLGGWVRNLSNGQVELEVEGPPTSIDEFLTALREGPTFAEVTDIQVQKVTVMNDPTEFIIIT